MIEKDADYNSMTDEQAKEYFDKNYNIGYVDESLPKPDVSLLLSHYLASALVYGVFVLLFLFCPFYTWSVPKDITNFKYNLNIICVTVYFIYLVSAPIFLLIFKPKTVYISHNIEVIKYFIKLIKREDLPKNASAIEILDWIKPTYKQSQSLMLLFIKFFYAPQLIIWTILHFNFAHQYFDIFKQYQNKLTLSDEHLSFYKLCTYYRPVVWVIITNILFFLDTLFFSIGYCTELTIFKNRIRTVETSVFGITVCLICYTPFSSILNTFVALVIDEKSFEIAGPNSIFTWLYYLLAFMLLITYTLASTALFTKASNLTNRGTVTRFPYSIIRHPAYTTKLIFWWLSAIVLMKDAFLNINYANVFKCIFGMLAISCIYYLRAITEEKHLSKDPDYRAYMKKVKYRFIPYFW